jgi:hypothetical protein
MIKGDRHRITDAELCERLIYLNALSLVLRQKTKLATFIVGRTMLPALSLSGWHSQTGRHRGNATG